MIGFSCYGHVVIYHHCFMMFTCFTFNMRDMVIELIDDLYTDHLILIALDYRFSSLWTLQHLILTDMLMSLWLQYVMIL